MTYLIDSKTRVQTEMFFDGTAIPQAKCVQTLHDFNPEERVLKSFKETGHYNVNIGGVQIISRILNPVRDLTNTVFILENLDARNLIKGIEITGIDEITRQFMYMSVLDEELSENHSVPDLLGILKQCGVLEFPYFGKTMKISIKN